MFTHRHHLLSIFLLLSAKILSIYSFEYDENQGNNKNNNNYNNQLKLIQEDQDNNNINNNNKNVIKNNNFFLSRFLDEEGDDAAAGNLTNNGLGLLGGVICGICEFTIGNVFGAECKACYFPDDGEFI